MSHCGPDCCCLMLKELQKLGRYVNILLSNFSESVFLVQFPIIQSRFIIHSNFEIDDRFHWTMISILQVVRPADGSDYVIDSYGPGLTHIVSDNMTYVLPPATWLHHSIYSSISVIKCLLNWKYLKIFTIVFLNILSFYIYSQAHPEQFFHSLNSSVDLSVIWKSSTFQFIWVREILMGDIWDFLMMSRIRSGFPNDGPHFFGIS